MSTPVEEKCQPIFETSGRPPNVHDRRLSTDDTVPGSPGSLHLRPTDTNGTGKYDSSVLSSGRAREEAHRHGDDLEVMRAEFLATRRPSQASHTNNLFRSASKRDSADQRLDTPMDELDDRTNPVYNGKKTWRPPQEPTTSTAKIHESSVFVRYFTYIVPLALILIIPLLLGALKYTDATVCGVDLMWFMVWLEVVWLSLWAGRVVSKMIPYPVGVLASIVTNGAKKWRDMAVMLEVPATLFFWWLSIYVSFLPIMRSNHHDGSTETKYWEKNANIVLLCFFIASILNLIQKIIVQLIAISFHIRTYQDRIEISKFQIASLAKLYQHAKDMERDLSEGETGPSEVLTPKVALAQAGQRFATKLTDVMGKIAGDFTGKQINSSTSPQQVVLNLLQSTEGSGVLARRLYRAYVRPEEENVHEDDLRGAFDDNEEAEAAFSMFDRDLNDDISCEEVELACVEIGRERKAIAASLKDLDSVIGKLDDCLTFVVFLITLMVFLSLISKSTAGVLTSASSSILALSWLFSATAQEFLASLVFVFVKHPFDVGDRVDIYNTGISTTDSFYIREIALMYTEMKKLTGEIVQAPNSLLNTLFILNMRRSGGLAEPVPITVKFGTTIEQIDELRGRMLEFVKTEKREYQSKIITELRDMPDMHAVKINVVFFYKSNWQNELVRLHRRNKFMCTLMQNVAELGIESPNMRWPGQKQTAPVWLQNIPNTSHLPPPPPPVGGHPDESLSPTTTAGIHRNPSVRSTGAGKKVDFSLGMRDMMSMDDAGDVFGDDRPSRRLVPLRRVVEEDGGEGSGISRTRSGSFRRRPRPTRSSQDSGSTHRRNWFWKHDEEMAIPGPSGHGHAGVLERDPGSMVPRSNTYPPHASVNEEVELKRM